VPNYRRMISIGVAFAVCLSLGMAAAAAAARQIEGSVFLDDNANGLQDPGEPGIAHVAVSDGTTIIWTDALGVYRLPLDEAARFVFASTPTGTRAAAGWYQPIDDASRYDFPLTRVEEEGPLVFVQISDIHYAPTPEEFRLGLRDRQMKILPDPVLDAISDDVNAFDVDFVLIAGDLAADSKYPEPEVVDAWIGAVADRFRSDFTAPVYAAIGNHDIVLDESIGKSIYEGHFGPSYYSFNMKGTHIVVLDTHTLNGAKLIYSVDERQIEWLRQDLSRLDHQTPIIVFCHEPTFSWADTPESRSLFDLLQESSITALLTGHWHTNVVLREEPFYELTSGAACGAWWEGPGPDGTGFGYRVFHFARGNLDSIWRTGGVADVDMPSPSQAVLTWADRLRAQTWGAMAEAGYSWDDGEAIPLDVYWNGLWSSVVANINVSALSDGYHAVTVEFVAADGQRTARTQTYLVSNPNVPLGEVFGHVDTYQGRIIAAPELEVRAVMGSDISARDETKTIIISGFPYPVSRNDVIGLVGLYHPTSTAPVKVYDDVFYIIVEDDEE
jgi:predicted MPP superfamily phosphohydrolase